MRGDPEDDRATFKRRLWTVAVWGLALLIPVWLWTAAPGSAWPEPAPAALVRDYLEAIRARNVDRALEIARRQPSAEESVFLTAQAIDGDWEVDSVVTIEEWPAWATVEAVIVAGDGSRTRGRFGLKKDEPDQDWWLVEPLLHVRFEPGPLWYGEVNGVKVPAIPDTEITATPEEPVYLLFPGVYRFHTAVPGLVDVAATDPVPLLPARRNPHLRQATLVDVRQPTVTLTDAGEQRMQTAVNAYIDDCALRMRGTTLAGCPFGVLYIRGPHGERALFDDYRDIVWKVGDHPVIAATVGRDSILLTHRWEGSVHVTATAMADGDDFPVAADCPVTADRLAAGVLADGSITVVAPDITDDPFQWTDC